LPSGRNLPIWVEYKARDVNVPRPRPPAPINPLGNVKLYLAAIFSLLALSVALTATATYASLRTHFQRRQQAEVLRAQSLNLLLHTLVAPTELSTWMSRDALLLDWLRQGEKNPVLVLEYLKGVSAEGKVSAFLASNRSRTYYFSDGTSKPLTRQTPDVGWFFQLLERGVERLTDVGYDNGDTSKPFLYIDLRMPDLDGKPSAYVGAAMDLHHFQGLLAAYKQRLGDDLHFVNEEGMVVLSSQAALVNTPASSHPWHSVTMDLPHDHALGSEKTLAFRNLQGRPFSVSREWLGELGWHLYSERDLQADQAGVRAIILRTIGLISLLIMAALAAMTVLLLRLRRQLQAAFAQIRTLKGILPICCSCKKIRDDHGYWQQLEDYLQLHTEADLSHGICPDCARKLYPELSHKHLE